MTLPRTPREFVKLLPIAFVPGTEDDASIEIYDLATQTGFTLALPNSGEQQIFSGADVEFDATNKLFLVAQPVSVRRPPAVRFIMLTTPAASVRETLDGYNFSNASTVIAMHIALKPSTRTGFVDGPGNGRGNS